MSGLWMEILAALAPDDIDMGLLAAGGMSAVADGPLPFGDVLLVGVVLGVGGRKAGKVGRLLYREAGDAMQAFRTYVQEARKAGHVEIHPPAHLEHGVRRATYDAKLEPDGYQLLRRKLPLRMSIPKAEKVLDSLGAADVRVVRGKVINGSVDRRSLQAGFVDDQKFELSDDAFDALREIVQSMYRSGMEQVPRFVSRGGPTQELTLIRETVASKAAEMARDGGSAVRHIDNGEGLIAASFVRNGRGAPSTSFRVVGDEITPGTNVSRRPDYPGGWVTGRDRQVFAMSGKHPHHAPERLEPGQERLFVRISFIF